MLYDRLLRRSTAILVFAVMAPLGVRADGDSGAPDTLRIHAGAVVAGQSNRVGVSIFNDTPISDLDFVLKVRTLDSGWLTFDSAVFAGRMNDPYVLSNRLVTGNRIDGVSPDTIVFAYFRNAGSSLPAGDDTLVWIYFTGRHPGLVSLDSTSIYGGVVSVDFVAMDNSQYIPRVTAGEIEVYENNPPPRFLLPDPGPVFTSVGQAVDLEVAARSPMGHPLRLDLLSMRLFDNDSLSPAVAPELDSLSPAALHWRPTASDVGIWRVELAATDVDGRRTVREHQLEVVSSRRYIVPMTVTETPDVALASAILHGDLDGDGFADLILPSNPVVEAHDLAVYRYSGSGQFAEVFARAGGQYGHLAVLGFLDDDSRLDLLMACSNSWQINRGRGNGTFETSALPLSVPHGSRTGVLLDYDGDARLDFACAGYGGVTIYRGASANWFTPATAFQTADSAIAISSSDFNRDGRDDLVVGTLRGLEIYLNDNRGGFTRAATYEQAFESRDIEVTNDGSDFNGDDRYDLCIATPSVGGSRSRLMVYLGRLDGSFEQRQVRDLVGTVLGVATGDFNGDHRLDIAFVNGSERYLGLMFGDGSGYFPNEIRLPVPRLVPRSLDCLDVDRDGDLDMVVSSSEMSLNSKASLYLFENELNPADVLASSLEIQACDNARLTVIAPDSGRLSDVAVSLSASSYERRRANDNDQLDVTAALGVLRPGRYQVAVEPKPGQPAGELFSLDYVIDGTPYRLARDQSMPGAGIVYSVYPDGDSPVQPAPGAFLTSAVPTFVWTSSGADIFELAADPGFSQVLDVASVVGGVYTLSMVLPQSDSTMYFWRVRPENDVAWGETRVFNAVRVPTDVDDREADPALPDSHSLSQNYPNPFNPTTTIEYHLAQSTHVTISIHNVLGQLIEVLVDETMPSGTFTVDWDAKDSRRRDVASGIYFYRLSADNESLTRKMVLVR